MKIAKAVVAAVGGIVMVLTVAFADDVFNIGEIGETIATLIEAAVTVYGVWRIRNYDASNVSEVR